MKYGSRTWIDFFPKRACEDQQVHERVFSITYRQGKCKSKLWCDITLHLPGWLLSKRQQKTSVGQNVEEREPWTLLMGMEIVLAIMENKMKFPQKQKNRTTTKYKNPTKYILNDTKSLSQGDTCILMLIEILFIITKIWKQLCVPTIDEWMRCCIYSGIVFIHE